MLTNCTHYIPTQDYIVAEVAIEAKEAMKGDSRERFQASLHTDLLTVYR